MIKVYDTGGWLLRGSEIVADDGGAAEALSAKLGRVPTREEGLRETLSWGILERHNTSGNMDKLKIKFDCMTSHDITYVGIVQTARASGLREFPLPYVLTNCHNSLCAVGGTINEDDHMFGLTACQKYGGIFVPAHQAVIHQYMREMMSGCGKMILGSDSHTRYGALGSMSIGEGGPELVKQLLGRTYDIDRPGIVMIYLTGAPRPGIGPMDVALAIEGAVFQSGYVKNKIMEFVGDGVGNLSAEFRIGIDVMTTETTCLSSIWRTDETVRDYLALHGRPEAYRAMNPGEAAYYDGVVVVDLSEVEPMIAMPFHPSNVFSIRELRENLEDILADIEQKGTEQLATPGLELKLRDKIRDGRLLVDQAIIAGCSGGTFENICDAADILEGVTIGNGTLSLSVYPSSQPINLELMKNGVMGKLVQAGAVNRTAFCGPCFGAGDVPANGQFSIRHVTRNFPNRDGSKPGGGQIASVAMMDARSIAATVQAGGLLTGADELDITYTHPAYHFDGSAYESRVYQGFGKADPATELKFGPNITDWPKMEPLAEDLLLKVCSLIIDPVTTTDELIPSGETSSYRSNPLRLAEFALSRKDPAYVGKTKAVQALESARLAGKDPTGLDQELAAAFDRIKKDPRFGDKVIGDVGIGGVVYAKKPGDGSAREQAASCQKVLGTFANIAEEYATKRYRSNLINWGMLPFLCEGIPFEYGDWLFVPGVRQAVEQKQEAIPAYVAGESGLREFTLHLAGLTDDERAIILDGCLINYYASGK